MSVKFNKEIVYAPCFLPDFLNPQRLLNEDKAELYEKYTLIILDY